MYMKQEIRFEKIVKMTVLHQHYFFFQDDRDSLIRETDNVEFVSKEARLSDMNMFSQCLFNFLPYFSVQDIYSKLHFSSKQ